MSVPISREKAVFDAALEVTDPAQRKLFLDQACAGDAELRAAVEASGFVIEHWNDLTDQAGAFMQVFLNQPANPLGLHAFVTDFNWKVENLTRGLADGRLRAIQGVARASTI